MAVCSGTAKQATIILGKIKLLAEHENILREIEFTSPKNVVQVTSDRAICRLKNGSKIETFSVATMRGQRAKIVVVDESPEVDEEDLNAIISPVKNFKRDVTHTYGIPDYPSKVVNISSACEKSNFFYKEFLRVAREMSHGNRESFASALDYRAAARSGLTDMRFFEDERKRLPQSKFDMEYGSIFMGAEANSVFPYSLTEPCRVLKRVELAMPKGSQSHYVIGFDIATSVSKEADNSVIVVVKLVEQEDGSYVKQ